MALFPDQKETDHLELRRCSRETVDPFDVHEYFTPDGTTREEFEYVNLSTHETVYETESMIREIEQRWEEGTSARYVIVPTGAEGESDAFAGLTGLRIDWDRQIGNVGFWLRKPYWGKGYGRECLVELLDLAFDRLSLDVVKYEYVDANEKAEAMIETFVTQYSGQYDGLLRNGVRIDGVVHDKHRWTITSEQYADFASDLESPTRSVA